MPRCRVWPGSGGCAPIPWAGAVSTAHTLLHYARFGRAVFRLQAREPEAGLDAPPRTATARFDLDACAAAVEREGQIWYTLVREQRHVSRAAYLKLARAAARTAAPAGPLRVRAEEEPQRLVRGRRPSHAPNQALSR